MKYITLVTRLRNDSFHEAFTLSIWPWEVFPWSMEKMEKGIYRSAISNFDEKEKKVSFTTRTSMSLETLWTAQSALWRILLKTDDVLMSIPLEKFISHPLKASKYEHLSPLVGGEHSLQKVRWSWVFPIKISQGNTPQPSWQNIFCIFGKIPRIVF